MSTVQVTTIVATFNAESWILPCIQSVQESSLKSAVIVVDNNSQDATRKLLMETFPSVELISNNSNVGFGRANNIGIEQAIKKKAEYIFLLNQDARIHFEMLGRLVQVADQMKDVGILSPIHLNYSGNAVDKAFQKYTQQYVPEFFSGAVCNQLKNMYLTQFVPAALWLVRVAALRDVGGFDPLFFMYGEDDDLAARMINRGWKIGIVPRSVGFHDHGERNPKKVSERRIVGSHLTRNIIQLKDPSRSFPRNWLRLSQNTFAKFAQHIINRQIAQARLLLMAWMRTITLTPQIHNSRERCINEGAPYLNI